MRLRKETFYGEYILYSVSAPNWSLNAMTKWGDGTQEMDNIKKVVNNIIGSPSIV